MSAPKIAVITGPTATGKSALGVLLAQSLGGEIVSADSMQIYRGMDIGTAKVTREEMQGVPHHMIDVADPSESFSAARYVEMADKCVQDILERGKLPVIVGGTGLYIDSLVAGTQFAGLEQDEALRKELNERYDAEGGEAMLAELMKIDPERAAKLHPSDKKRIVRAIEIFRITGKTMTEHDEATKAVPPRYDAVKIALMYADREKLYERIDARVDKMAAEGLFSEVKRLLAAGVPEKCTAMQAIGYKEAAAAIAGKCTEAEAIEQIKLASRRYAKRQLTWLRRDGSVHWIFWQNEPDFESARHISTNFISPAE